MEQVETIQAVIERLGYDPHELVECINTHVPKNPGDGVHTFELGDHRGLTKTYTVKPGERFKCERGTAMTPRRMDAPSKKGLGSLLDMITSGDCVMVESAKGQAYIAKQGKKAA